MKVFLHIGPHKTGTTAVQSALQAHAASGRATYHYPAPGSAGPGHAELAWRLLGLKGRPAEPDAMEPELQRARDSGIDKVVLSSEEFAWATFAKHSFRPLDRLRESATLELIITLRPLVELLYSEMQELVKHGRAIDFDDTINLISASTQQPGLRPDFLPAAITGVAATSTSVIFVDKHRPRKIYKAISEVIGDSVPPPDQPTLNTAYPFLKLAWLNSINKNAPDIPYVEGRMIAAEAYAAAVKKAPAIADVPYPEIDPAFQRYLAMVWNAQLAYVESLRAAGHVRVW